MLLPALYNQILVVFNDIRNLLHIAFLDTFRLHQEERLAVPVEFGISVISLDVDVNGVVLLAIEEETESEKAKDLGSGSNIFSKYRY